MHISINHKQDSNLWLYSSCKIHYTVKEVEYYYMVILGTKIMMELDLFPDTN